jgi:hypothetical protein
VVAEVVQVNRQSLKELLEREGIDPSSYSLEGGMPVEAYVLESGPSSWSVYYSERGLRTGEVTFASEDEACSRMFEMLLRDPTTRRH